ncbi:hypothetical protein M3Y97_00837100 [Aphelenchoides bicaudatus]|nr:hypothetical protein M3Y97_00837100 [Aphelenchoides bicaudatus]
MYNNSSCVHASLGPLRNLAFSLFAKMNPVTTFLLFTFVVSNNGYSTGQLPQLINADGSLTAHHDQQAVNPNYYSNYPQQIQQPFQQAGNFLAQTGSDLKQGAQNFGSDLKQGAQNFGHQMQNHVQNAGEALGNAPRNFVDGMHNIGNQLSQGFDNMVQNGLNKLNELKGQFAEKFRPLLDNAIQIFQTPKTEKEKWNELVQRVEATNLSEQEKQQLYQKIADATGPQQSGRK